MPASSHLDRYSRAAGLWSSHCDLSHTPSRFLVVQLDGGSGKRLSTWELSSAPAPPAGGAPIAEVGLTTVKASLRILNCVGAIVCTVSVVVLIQPHRTALTPLTNAFAAGQCDSPTNETVADCQPGTRSTLVDDGGHAGKNLSLSSRFSNASMFGLRPFWRDIGLPRAGLRTTLARITLGEEWGPGAGNPARSATLVRLSSRPPSGTGDAVAADQDVTPPTVNPVLPAAGAVHVTVVPFVTAVFSEPMDPATVDASTFELRNASNMLVPATVTYRTATNTATLDPTGVLAYSTTYSVRIKGGPTDPRVKDVAGTAMASDFTWSFTTAASPETGPGGPILVITSAANRFSRYYAEILRAEGLNAFDVRDLSAVNGTTLAAYDVAILGEMTLTPGQVTMFHDWVDAGGNLIAMRPDKQLAGLLGVTRRRRDTVQRIPEGRHRDGRRSRHRRSDDPVSRHRGPLFAQRRLEHRHAVHECGTATANPAVTLRAVGPNGGQAASFTFDLARSVVYTRQGNPAWAGDDRDGRPGRPLE